MSAAVIVLNIAYIALVTATLTSTLQRLRAVLIVSAAAFIAFGVLQGIWPMVVWNVLIGGMHLFRLVRDRVPIPDVVLEPDEQAIRDEFFSELDDADFAWLWRLGEEARWSDQVLVRQGTRPCTVSLVLDGAATVERGGRVVAHIRRGGLVGEMSLVTGKPSEVDVVALWPVEARRWHHDQIRGLDADRPACARAMRKLLSKDLVAKARLSATEARQGRNV